MKEYNSWLKQAEKDLDTAKYNIDGRKLEAGAFFLQQAVEKALKALYIKKFARLIKTHDLVLLARELKVPQNLEEFCKKLTPAYQYTRYPDITKEIDLENKINEFMEYSKEIIKWVKKNL
ncbi:HEPN domain-containing protein [Candidatus Pacearchaeota archaeon]|nr:HEPN domain-containing protein [Candidatus Pacearchaeota archaeon]